MSDKESAMLQAMRTAHSENQKLHEQIGDLKLRNTKLSEALNMALTELEARHPKPDFERFILRKKIRTLAGWETR